MSESDDKTEAATPRRVERARAEGSVAVSREVPALAALGAATLVLAMAGPSLGRGMIDRLTPMVAMPLHDPAAAIWDAALATLTLAAPIVLAALAAASAATFLQTGFLFSAHPLLPDLQRLSPMRGLKRVFGVRGLVDAGKSSVKLGVLGFATYHVLSATAPGLAGAVFWLPGHLASRILGQVLQLMMTLLGVQAVIAGADVVWIRYRHGRDLRMSKEDLRQEAKESDGNPQVKARLRQIRMARSRKRMLAAVPSATVVVTNPTHYAIALSYDRAKGGAPRVVAKGMDEVAARIREAAREHRVPLVANPPLARALYGVDVDGEIPGEHFKAVAEIIAYVWRLRGRQR